MKSLAYPVAAVAALLAVACGSSNNNKNPNPDDTGEIARSDKQRLTAPQVADADSAALAQGNMDFAFDLYQQLRGEDGNLFYSPHSISTALSMLYAGARNNTASQIAETMHFQLTQQRLHPANNLLDLELESRGEGASGADAEPFRLNVVNALWGQKGMPLLPDFLDTLALNYGAGLRLLDFATDPELSRTAINEWVEQQTEDRIEDLLPERTITPGTRLVLTNAIYFNASWAEPFAADLTQDAQFTLPDDTRVTVKMMDGGGRMHYAKEANFAAASIPYDGQELSLLLIVPDEGQLAQVEQSLSRTVVDGLLAKMSTHQVHLKLPTFETKSDFDLTETLDQMGMSDLMDAGLADLSGLTGSKGLYVTSVVHKAFVKIDEKGTEAAAATGVVVGETSAPTPVDLFVDRPFIIMIRDHATGAVLFVGRIVDPSA